MFKGIRHRLITYFFVVIAVIVILMGGFFIWFLNYLYMQTLRDNLHTQARLAATLVEEMMERDAPPGEIDQLCKDLGSELGVRLTLIDRDGTVLADSAENPVLMENHGERPEIIEAFDLQKGVAVRYSVTLDEEMYYLAIPLPSKLPGNNNENALAVIRLALPLAGINQAVFNLVIFIFTALFVSSLIALTAAVIFSQKITGPISKISSAAHAIAEGDFTPTLDVGGKDELTALAQNIREMGLALNKKIEQVLWEKNKLDTVVSSMSSGIILIDREMKIELINPAAESLFDLKREEVVGEQFSRIIREYALNESLKVICREGEAKITEVNLYYPRSAVLDTYLLPVTESDSKLIGILLLFHETTELRSIEKMRSDFVANISHELRTPLTSIRGYTETILHEELDRGQLIDFLKVIDRETSRLASLLDDLLDLAQIENEKGFVQKEAVDLAELLDKAVADVENLHLHKDIAITVALPQESLIVEGNSEWLRQAVINVLENSIRHGYPKRKIGASLYREDQQAVVEISDNGPGIPEADLPHIFERFYRVDKARSRKSGGTGLGLSIVKHIMEAHGATFSLQSKEDEETTFCFKLPLIKYPQDS